MNLLKRIRAARVANKQALAAKNKEVSRRKWLRAHSKNYRLGRVKSACSGFGRITTYGHGVEMKGPTHFGCGPGFKKIK